jgi:predicted RNA-binding protein with PUA-like domain
VVGLARVAKESYTDPTADDGDWSAVDIAAEIPLVLQVTLAQIKADKTLKEMVLAKQSRLSVSPVTREQFERLLKLAGTKV